MQDRQKIISIYVSKAEFEAGNIDVTERLYKEIDREQVESIKYMMPTAGDQGMYFTIVIIEKQENAKSGMGF